MLPLNLPSLDVDVRSAPLPAAARAYLAGLAFALAASPCSTPVLATLLAYVSATEDPIQGGGLLLAYSTGVCQMAGHVGDTRLIPSTMSFLTLSCCRICRSPPGGCHLHGGFEAALVIEAVLGMGDPRFWLLAGCWRDLHASVQIGA